MFKTITAYCAFNLRISIFLALLSCFSGSASEMEATRNYTDSFNDTQEFNLSPDWKLAPLGVSAAEFLRLSFIHSDTGPIRSTIQAGTNDYKKFIQSVIGYTFIQQIPMTFVVALGLLGVFLLLLMPCFIVVYRNRQISRIQDSETESEVVSPTKGWMVFEILLVFSAIVIFGGIIMCLAITDFDDKFPEIFEFAVFAVRVSHKTKGRIRSNYYFNLMDISRNAFDTANVLYTINDDVSSKFLQNMSYRINPVRYVARSFEWDVQKAEHVLKTDKKRLESLQEITDKNVIQLKSEYLTTLNTLKKLFDDENANKTFGNVVDPLLQLPDYNATNMNEGIYDKSIENLRQVGELSNTLAERIQNITRYLRNSIDNLYDPAQIIFKLKNVTLTTENDVRLAVASYVDFVDRTFREEKRIQVENDIRKVQQAMLDGFHNTHILILIFGIVSILLAAFFFTAYCFGVIGTQGFRPKSSGICVYKTNLSHRSGKAIIIFTYFTVIFLAVFLAISIFVYFISTAPFELCLSLKDKSLIDVSIDNPRTRRTPHWYSMFSSEKFKTTLRENIINCMKDASFFAPLPDPMVSKASFEAIKEELDTDSVTEAINNVFQNIPYSNISESESSILNLDNVLNIKITYFDYILQFTRDIKNTNASEILNKIKNHPQSSDKLSSSAETAIKSYDSFIETLSTTTAEQVTYEISLNSLNITIQMVKKQIDDFKLSSEALADFIQQNGTYIYLSLLNDTLKEMIDGIYYGLDISSREFRNTISFCPILNLLYKKVTYIICQRFLYPISVCWLGSFLVAIFLPLSVFLCIYTIPLFIITPKVQAVLAPPPPVVLPLDTRITAATVSTLDTNKSSNHTRDTQTSEDDANTEGETQATTPNPNDKTQSTVQETSEAELSASTSETTSKRTTDTIDERLPTAQETTNDELPANTSNSSELTESNNRLTDIKEQRSSIKENL